MEQYGFTTNQFSRLTIENFLIANLLPVTIGNILGGMVFGLALYYLNKAKEPITVKEEMKDESGIVFDNSIAGVWR